MKKIIGIFTTIFCLSLITACDKMNKEKIIDQNYDCLSNYEDRVNFGAKFEPKGNYILHGAGQANNGVFETFDKYVAAVEKTPAVSMGYTTVHHKFVDWCLSAQKHIASYEEKNELIMLQIGVHFNRDENPDETYYDKVADGTLDTEFKSLIKSFKALKVPIYCRPGFEFNGEWNGYTDANIFVKAFRHFKELVDECGATNIALLWCMNPDAREKNFMKYYPGDEYVDWFAIDIFRIGSCEDQTTTDFLEQANAHKKPVMITETTPYTYNVVEGNGWNEWFVKYFNFVRSNPVIKGTCYINWRWTDFPQWSNWGDARLEESTNNILLKYQAEISDPVYLHSHPKSEINNFIYGYKK